MTDILHIVTINAPAGQVYNAITQPEGLAGWWTRTLDAEAGVGAVNEFRFANGVFNRMKVTALTPGQRVEWECVGGADAWIGTRLVFEMIEKDGQTKLRFDQRGWVSTGDFYRHCNHMWGLYLYSLKQYVETGSGHPYPDLL